MAVLSKVVNITACGSPGGQEPTIAMGPTLNVPEGVGVCPTHRPLRCPRAPLLSVNYRWIRNEMVDAVGIEPTTSRLRVECSTS